MISMMAIDGRFLRLLNSFNSSSHQMCMDYDSISSTSLPLQLHKSTSSLSTFDISTFINNNHHGMLKFVHLLLSEGMKNSTLIVVVSIITGCITLFVYQRFVKYITKTFHVSDEFTIHSNDHRINKRQVDKSKNKNTRRSNTSYHSENELRVLNKELIRRKNDFIYRVGGFDVYGYASSPGGYIDHWRAKEFPTLIEPISMDGDDNLKSINESAVDNNNNNMNDNSNDREVYLDYAGAALPTQSQLREILSMTASSQTLGNPHSIGPAASRTKQLIQQATKRVMDHFHAHSGKFHGGQYTTTTDNTTDSSRIDCHPGYEIVFTSGTTDAIRIVAERFPWRTPHSPNENVSSTPLFVYAQNSHTSVIGIREVALQQNPLASIVCQPVDELLETILQCKTSCQSLEDGFHQSSIMTNGHKETYRAVGTVRTGSGCRYCVKNLLVVPLECNFSGDRPDVKPAFQKLYELDHSTNNNNDETLAMCTDCQQKDHHQSWYTMLDIAKAASTSPINLCELNPDFACVSFYKMFGEPTGLGCLFVKRTAIDVLCPFNATTNKRNDKSVASFSNHRRQYVGGGAVNIIVPGRDYTVSSTSESTAMASLRSGTPHFRGIVALLAGFNELDRVGGMERIQIHTNCLILELVRRLQTLQHSNGQMAIVNYGDWTKVSLDSLQEKWQPFGPTVAFNVLRSDCSVVGYNEVSKLAALYHPPIQIRTGCFCNPGACQIAIGLSDDDLVRNYEESGHVCGDPIDLINNRPTGAIRVSFGKDSTWEDMDVFITFIQQMFVNHAITDIKTTLDLSRGERIPTLVVITELYIFPIKSCAAQRVTDWPMDPSSGRLQFDREFALVDSSGSAMRLQTYPKMALLLPVIDLQKQTLTIQAPNQLLTPLILHIDDQLSCYSLDRKQSTVKVCGNHCSGYLWGDHAVSEWFSQCLGVRCWLARHSGTPVECYEYTTTASTISPQESYRSLSFANEKPILLISEHAVNALNNIMRQSRGTVHPLSHTSVCSRQFRPNIVVRLDGKDDAVNPARLQIEDFWSQIFILDDEFQKRMTLDVVGPCGRCAMVDVDPTNGSKVETLRALAKYRRRGNAQITFGVFVQASPPSAKSSLSMKNESDWHRLREGTLLLCV